MDVNRSADTSFSSWTSEGSTDSSLAIVRRKRMNELRENGYICGAATQSDGEAVWFKLAPDGKVRHITTDGIKCDTSFTC